MVSSRPPIITIVIITPCELFTPALGDGFTLESGTLLGILADLNNAVVWMVSSRPPIITIIMITPWEFFTSALADGFY